MYLVESLGYFLPDKPSSVPESNPNSEDEAESEDTIVKKKGRKYCFHEEWVRKFDRLRSQREKFHEPQILTLIPATCREHEIWR